MGRAASSYRPAKASTRVTFGYSAAREMPRSRAAARWLPPVCCKALADGRGVELGHGLRQRLELKRAVHGGRRGQERTFSWKSSLQLHNSAVSLTSQAAATALFLPADT
jgi:hypothetical protein